MNKTKLFSWSTLIVPWFTLPLIGKRDFLRFLPAALLANSMIAVFSLYAGKKNLWKVSNPILPKSKIDISFVAGIFFIGTIWIFKLTYGKFWRYITLNLLTDAFFAFPTVWLLGQLKLFRFKKLKAVYFFIGTVGLAALLYPFQGMVERLENKEG